MDLNDEEIELTTYDRLLRAWENSKELVRDYEVVSKKVPELEVSALFKKFAEDEGKHANTFREMLLKYDIQ